MPLGPLLRRLCGPFEHRIAAAYRGLYFDVDRCVDAVRRWSPQPRTILEVGCGEGAVTEALARAFPEARITGIDITPRVGRLYRGPCDRVRFAQATVQEIAADEPGRYDLVLLVDVIHHVPLPLRPAILAAAAKALAPSGRLILKEWERRPTPIHWLCYASDRWLTGDRIAYMSRDEAGEMLGSAFGAEAVVGEARVAPWRNNMIMLVAP